jgi:hypothetical protein
LADVVAGEVRSVTKVVEMPRRVAGGAGSKAGSGGASKPASIAAWRRIPQDFPGIFRSVTL